jgi:hypothetical protein
MNNESKGLRPGVSNLLGKKAKSKEKHVCGQHYNTYNFYLRTIIDNILSSLVLRSGSVYIYLQIILNIFFS